MLQLEDGTVPGVPAQVVETVSVPPAFVILGPEPLTLQVLSTDMSPLPEIEIGDSAQLASVMVPVQAAPPVLLTVAWMLNVADVAVHVRPVEVHVFVADIFGVGGTGQLADGTVPDADVQTTPPVALSVET